ncbi:Rossmann-fold NAD(P)-binding domain-containing protein [Phytohabitans suffuscus]|uniref:Uncharacterized protein n=1 Tax=Phytohabitans suffuscus TaxID=624315 RepID=A0A6F8YQ12_9ACTN|nr:hypothetical protein [Phytohabitans suffuscus]BCB88220.1 hypothetical protein Psuf_055330 [Phytohabitans suffuscus]
MRHDRIHEDRGHRWHPPAGPAVVRALGIQLDLVSPGWTSETLALPGMDPATGTPAARVAQTYVDLVQGSANGDNIVPRQQI